MPHELNVNGVWLPHQDDTGDADTAWARRLDALKPHHAGVYLNFMDVDDTDRHADAFAPRRPLVWTDCGAATTPTRSSQHPPRVPTPR